MNSVQNIFKLILVVAITALAGAGHLCAYTNEYYTSRWQITGYRSNYFIIGNPVSKLLFSAKIQMIEGEDLYLAYSQLMFWALQSDSKPFRDLNYNPELFYRVRLNNEKKRWLDLGIYEHESNGRAGIETRSWDRFYLRYNSGLNKKLYWDIKAWVPYNYDAENGNIADYRGLWELNIVVKTFLGPKFDRNDITLRIYPGGPSHIDPLRGGQEITYRANRSITKRFLPVLVIQYFHGYGESLLDYEDEKNVVRIGFGF